jgi:outer membrane protein assembly factor BamD (BamD/ComL family)
MREPQLPPPTQLRRLARLQPNPPAPDAAAELLARAHQAESAGRYAEAAGLYAQLASLDDPRASAALYELARLQLRFLGQPASALASLEEQRTRFPESPLAQEAALSAIDARLALGEDTASLREMDAFLAQFPSSERAGEVRWLRARLALRRGDCGSAREDLTALVAVGAYSGEALLAQALCARRAGDEPAARAFLRDYLKRDPHGSRRGEAQAALSGGPLGAP